MAVKNTIMITKAHAQQQEDKLFIIMKVQKSDIDNAYDLNNVTRNLNKVLLSSVAVDIASQKQEQQHH